MAKEPTAPVTSPFPAVDLGSAYQPRCRTVPDVDKIETIDGKFKALREYRQTVIQLTQQAIGARDLLKNRFEDLTNRQTASMVVGTATQIPTGQSLEVIGTGLAARAATLSNQLSRANAENRDKDAAELQKQLDEVQEKLVTNAAAIAEQKARQDQEKNALARREAQIQEIKNSAERLRANLQQANLDIDCLTAAQSKSDELIYSLLIPETQKNDFKLWMSAIFAFMVLVVIVGFFAVSFKDDAVRGAIFSNQTGIQFVTLFSLVIAIILFGITEILQAKELAALLGGISGYILGRVTTDRATAPIAPGSVPATVIASTISFIAPNIIRSTASALGVFPANSKIRVSGSGANNADYTIAAASTTEIRVVENVIKDEPAGILVTIRAL